MAMRTPEGDWLDAAGKPVPVRYVPPHDRKRDQMVEKALKAATKASAALGAANTAIWNLIDDHLDYLESDAGLPLNDSGDYQFTTFSGHARVTVKGASFIELSDKIYEAKALLNACMDEWTAEVNKAVRVLAAEVFPTAKGRLNVRKVISLLKYRDADRDERWHRGMELIAASINEAGRKSYVVIETRERGEHGGWEAWKKVPLSLNAFTERAAQ